MPSSKITVPNQLGKDEALSRIKGVASGSDNADVQETWTEDGGTFSGKIHGLDVSGSIEVSDTSVEIDLTYPMAARPFKSKIESTIQERAEALLAP
jgi:Putative polyhydroxyalkanoic acid system protein (PHA_gran_rgn)